MKPLLNKARRTATIDVAGEPVTIRELSVADSQGVKRDGEDDTTVSLRLIVASVVDADGNRAYTDDDIPALQELSLLAMKALIAGIRSLNGFQSPNH